MAAYQTLTRPTLGPLLDVVAEHVERCEGELRAGLPAATRIVDVHTHLGVDDDGMIGDVDELVATLDHGGIDVAFTFALNAPDRSPAFRAANDRTIDQCERAAGRLIPFARLDLDEGPVQELTRCLARGVRGIKLHPRAQRFAAGHPQLEQIFALAAEAVVPILVHGGGGIGSIADELGRLVEAHPGSQLIVAHAGIGDSTRFVRCLAGLVGVYFDTSTWSPVDLLDLFASIPPEQIVYGSDYPYGQQPASLYGTLRTAVAAGLSAPDVRAVVGGTALRIADARSPLPPRAPQAVGHVDLPLAMLRVHQYISMAVPLLWARRRDLPDALGLAVSACDPEEHERLREMLTTARSLWRLLGEQRPSDPRTVARAILQLLQLADVLAVCG